MGSGFKKMKGDSLRGHAGVAHRAKRTLAFYGKVCGTDDLETNIVDLVADLIQFAAANDIDWSDVLRQGENHAHYEMYVDDAV